MIIPLWAKGLVLAAAVGAIAYGGWHANGWRLGVEAEKARAEDLANKLRIQGEVNAAQKRTSELADRARDAAEVARIGAERAGSELQQRYRAALARACSAAPGVGASGAEDAGVLADVQRRLEEAGGQYAARAERALIRGEQCAADYDAVERAVNAAGR